MGAEPDPMLLAEVGEPRLRSRRVSLRRDLIGLLLLAMLPLTLVALLYGFIRLENRNAQAVRLLSDNAAALADANRATLDDLTALVTVVGQNPQVLAGGPACNAALARARTATAAFTNLAFYGPDRQLRCAAVGAGRAITLDPGWFAWLSRQDRAHVSDVMFGPLSNRRVVVISVPLRDAAGRFAGVVSGSVDLDWLARQLAGRSGVQRTEAVIVGNGGAVQPRADLPPLDAGAQPGTVQAVRDRNGRRWSYTIIPLVPAAAGQPELRVAYAAPAPARFGLEWWQTIVDFLLPVAAVAMATLAIWFGAQRLVVRWLVGLQRLALAFARGEYRSRPVSFAAAPREIRAVAATLYRMAAAVDERDRQLREAIDRQRLLAREVHHRVKNNFQVVMSLLSLQAAQLRDVPPARTAIDRARRRVGALALVHRLIYETGELSTVSSRSLLGALSDQLVPVLDNRIAYSAHFDDVPLDIDSAVPLTLWMVEAVSNAFEHGFPDGRGGAITVAFTADDGHAELAVIDDGVGLGETGVRGSGHGLRLIAALGQQLGGDAKIGNGEGGGVTARLAFPLKVRTLSPVPMPEPRPR